MTIILKNIRYLRLKNEQSQDYIAEKPGYKSYTTIQKWEMGTSEPPLKKAKQLADLFRVGIDDLAVLNQPDLYDDKPDIILTSSKETLLTDFRILNDDRHQKLMERAKELKDLGYVKRENIKMA